MGPVPERRVKLNPNVQQKPIGKLPPDAYVPDTNLNPYERATAHAVHELDNAIGIAKSVDDSKKLAVTQDAYSLACQRIETIWANIKKEQQSRKAALDIFLGPRIAPAFQKSIDRSKIAVIDTVTEPSLQARKAEINRYIREVILGRHQAIDHRVSCHLASIGSNRRF